MEVKERLRLLVAESHIAAPSGPEEKENAERDLKEAISKRQDAAKKLTEPDRLQMLSQAFSLTSFERDLILLCALVELDPSSAALCASWHGDSQMKNPTFGLSARALPEAHWMAISPDAPLRRWRLIEFIKGDVLAASSLRIDERVLHHLIGSDYLDERLRGLVKPVLSFCDPAASHRSLAQRIEDALSFGGDRPIISLYGSDDAGKQSIAAFVCESLGLDLYSMDAADIPANASEREDLARLWEREAALGHLILIVRLEDLEERDLASSLFPAISFLQSLGSIVLATSRRPFRIADRAVLRLEVQKPAPEEQMELWTRSLGMQFSELNGQLEQAVSQFNLSSEQIFDAITEIMTCEKSRAKSDLSLHLRTACKAVARPRLDELAERIPPQEAAWDDLILPEAQQQILREIEASVRQSGKVYRKWGFAGKGGRGLGISALFAGESGTGKTMAAEVLASRLDLDLYRIDLSQVVNKYIGETEKNLRRVFDAAESGGCILLFDEADAIFGKRSDVKDSHDRHANIEVGYLLQRIEAFKGLAILTTNLRAALDRAFLRRIRFVVQFPFPGESERAEIWRCIFPKETPLDGLDFEKLSRLNVTGGSIRNMALYSAFLAAEEDCPVRMRHILRAAKVEYSKLERPLSGMETRGWV
jgi:SpoVK/Ycf46/Vps4 family AAA+-type ATPase